MCSEPYNQLQPWLLASSNLLLHIILSLRTTPIMIHAHEGRASLISSITLDSEIIITLFLLFIRCARKLLRAQ
jgi:hypothetical protein